ncbi:hypothetical protein D3C76_1719860 [compost metagenome]
MARLKTMPRHLFDIAIDEPQAVGGILEDITHGQLAGWRQAGQILQQRIVQEIRQNVDPVA